MVRAGSTGSRFTARPPIWLPYEFMNSEKPGDRAIEHVVTVQQIEKTILLLRGHKVILDRDLAALYDVETKNLNKAVRRNLDRFPDDFMFQLTAEEADSLRFQFGTLKRGQHFKYLPYAFTEQGVAMLSSVLRSKPAVQILKSARLEHGLLINFGSYKFEAWSQD